MKRGAHLNRCRFSPGESDCGQCFGDLRLHPGCYSQGKHYASPIVYGKLSKSINSDLPKVLPSYLSEVILLQNEVCTGSTPAETITKINTARPGRRETQKIKIGRWLLVRPQRERRWKIRLFSVVSKSSCCLPEVLLLKNLRTSMMRSDFDVVLRLSTNRTLPINWLLPAAGAAGNRVFSLLERPPRGSSCSSYLHIIKMLNYKVCLIFFA